MKKIVMDIVQFINELKDKGIYLSEENNGLKIKFGQKQLEPEVLNSIKARKEELLAFFNKYKSEPKTQVQDIPQLAVQENYELSSGQKRLWVLSQFEEVSSAYNYSEVYEIEGDLNREVLRQSFDSLIERHEILRTVFAANEASEIRQFIRSPQEQSFEIVFDDLSQSDKIAEKTKAIVQKATTKSFDLANGPLIRGHLIQTAPEKYVFAYVIHHIISDGWSMSVVIKELFTLYAAFLKGEKNPLPALRIHYKDYAAWQQNQLSEENLKIHRDYWLTQFEGELPVLDFPTDKIRPAVKTYNGHKIHRILSKDLTSQFKNFIQEEGGTLFMGVLGLSNVLLSKYTGQDDIIVGSPVAGRDHTDLENQIGFYVNTMALRTRIDSSEGFRALFKKIKKSTLEHFDHQAYPFDQLIEDLGIAIDRSRTPLFDVNVTLQYSDVDAANEEQNIAGLSIKSYEEKESVASISEIGFEFGEIDGQLHVDIYYNTDLHHQATIEQLGDHLETILAAMLRSPEQALEQLDYLSDQEKNQLLQTFSTATKDWSKENTLVQLFEKQARETPDNVALVSKDKQLTYKEVEEQSNQLAHCLINNYHLQKEEVVAVQLDRNEWTIIAILGIMKAGGTYAPIDPKLPEERKEFMIKDMEVKLVLTEASYMFDFSFCENQLFVIDIEFDASEFSKEPVDAALKATDLAYIIYTSGSTGRPKGVMIEHRGIVNTILAQIDAFELQPGDRGLQFASFSFDASISEIFIILLSGGSLYLVDDRSRNNPELLEKYIVDNEIDIATISPSLLKLMNVQSLATLKVLITAGEAAVIDKTMEYLQMETGIYFNAYGPTETSICATMFKVERGQILDCLNIPIGPAITNAQVYILSEKECLQPIGVIGELCVGGNGLAKGYLNRPEMTAEKFVPNPYAKGERLYKTGDLARWLPDGNIEYLGRKDEQVKIRGFRIELGEIEEQLKSKADISNATVNVQTKDGNKEICAYVVSGTEQNSGALLAYLANKLPDYMMPATFVQLDELPLTTSGKVDKKALLKNNTSIASGVEYVAPENETQQNIATLWSGILGVERIGIHDSFFKLGGNSIKAVRLLSDYHKEFNVKLTLPNLFADGTLSAHADLINSSSKKTFQQIPAVEDQESYPVSDAQKMMWVLSQLEERSVAYNIPSSFILDKSYDIAIFKRAISALIERHEILRTVFKEDTNGELRQWILAKDAFKFFIDQRDYRGVKNQEDLVKAYLEKDAQIPFDLENGPLLRAGLLRLTEDQYLFYYNMHHIISDGWSSNVLANDILAYCEAYQSGINPSLPELRIQYKDYASWQQNKMGSEEQQSTRTYWLDKLTGEIPSLQLPTSSPRPKIKTYNGQIIGTYLTSETTTKLRAFTEERGGSLFMLVLSVWNVLFYRYTFNKDLIIGTPVAGRDHADLHHQIGCYINTVALRNQIKPEENFADFYERVKTGTLEDYAHQAYPFDRLRQDLDLKRDMARSVLFDVLLVLQDRNPNAANSTQEISTELQDLGKAFSKFDLEITFEELENNVSFHLNYNRDVYEADSMKGLMQHFIQLLDAVLSQPETIISTVNFMSDAEAQLLNSFNDTQIDYPQNKTVVDLFKETVQRVPEKVAIVYEDLELTFRELDELSNQLAAYLLANYNIQTEDLVGVQLDRSEWMLPAILAIIKSGAAYVPLDINNPAERSAYIKEDSNYKLCLDKEELEKFVAVADQYSRTSTETVARPDNLAYAIYTSGSTGVPKGVLNNHAGLYNRLLWMRDDLGISANDTLVQKTPYTFDVSVWELMMPLITGSKLVFAQPEQHKDPLYLQDLIQTQQVSIIHFVPPMLGAFLYEVDAEKCTSLRHVVCSGEALPAKMVQQFTDKLSGIRIHNLYGPTEAAIDVTSIDLTEVEVSKEGVSIGQVVPNTQIYITNPTGALQPLGVPGELVIAGVQVARGYLNRPELNKEKFIDNPFGEGKAYRTGDLVRYLSDGNIEYLGRMDHQVKIRGNRIELGEIENTIQKYAAVKQSVVLAKEDPAGNKRLLAYVLHEAEYSEEALREFMRSKLPEYMIPAVFIALEEFPLTTSGKVNRKNLPEPNVAEILAAQYVAPRNELEEKMAPIWQKELAYEQVGIFDNFFQIGGDSIIAIRVISQINKAFDTSLKVGQLYEFSTIADLCQMIAEIPEDGPEETQEKEDIKQSIEALQAEIFGQI